MCKGMFNVQHVFYLSSLPGLDDMALLSLAVLPKLYLVKTTCKVSRHCVQ